jgi:hypothetical protein
MSTNYTTTIPETDCIGDSLATINNNFDKLGTTILSLSTTPGWIPNRVIAFNGGAFGFRNKIINGDMRIWQRGTSFTNPANVSISYTADRMVSARANWTTGITTSQSTDVPVGFQYSLKQQRTAGNTSAETLQLHYTAETSDAISLQGKEVTFSFYAKSGSNFTGSNINASIVTSNNIDQNYLASQNVIVSNNNTLTTTWTRYTVTGTVPSNATQWRVSLFWTPVGTALADDTIYVTGLQLEVGPTATPFEYRPIGTELALCQRYYEKSFDTDTAPANGTSTSLATTNGAYYGVSMNGYFGGAHTPFKVTKRAVPIITSYGNSSGFWGWSNTGTQTTLTYTNSINIGAFPGQNGFYSIQQVVSNAFVVIGGHWTANAEL